MSAAAGDAADPPPPYAGTRALGGIGPRHELIYEDLCKRIRSGEYALDTQLPSERELTEMYGVSRATLRQALTRAEQDGIVTKVPGRGSFVSRRRVSQDLTQMQTFRSVIAELDMQPSYSVLNTGWVKASREIADRLHVANGARVLRVDSIGLASGRPMAAYRSHLAQLVAGHVNARLPDEARSTYELAASALGLDELRVDQTFEAIALDEPSAELLEAVPGSSAFRATSLFTTPDGEPVEFRIAVYPGGRYRFNVHRVVTIGR